MCGVCGVAVFAECVSWWRGPNLEGAVQQGQATKSTGRKGHPHAPGALQFNITRSLPSVQTIQRTIQRKNDSQWRRATAAVGYGAARLRTRRRPRFSRPDTNTSCPCRVQKVAQKKMGRSTWFRHDRRIPIPRIRFSLGLTGARWGSQLPPGSQGRQGPTRTALEGGRWLPLDSAWTATGADVHKPRPPAVPRIGGPTPPVRQDPQASTAANPLDGVQATAKTPSFTGGSRLVQLLGLLD